MYVLLPGLATEPAAVEGGEQPAVVEVDATQEDVSAGEEEEQAFVGTDEDEPAAQGACGCGAGRGGGGSSIDV